MRVIKLLLLALLSFALALAMLYGFYLFSIFAFIYSKWWLLALLAELVLIAYLIFSRLRRV